jgi:UDP-glucose 4-epimerase
MNNKTVLVTGVAGFIGRYITRIFSSQGWDVIGVDNSSPENASSLSLKAYYSLQLPSAELNELLKKHSPHLCIHAAGRASVGFSIIDPYKDFYANTVLTMELLESLRKFSPACKFIYLSSASVYGNPSHLPITESSSTNPISPYGFHKLQGEQLCREFYEIYGLSTASVRIFSAYGSGLRRQVLWDICYKALIQGKVFLQGTGLESRDFIHVIDIAAALFLVACHAPMQGECYNLGSGKEVTISELSTLILDSIEYGGSLEFDGKISPGNPRNWKADISRIEALGFQPSVSLEQGVRVFANWCRAELVGI